jgi:hypothetical protein
MTRGGPPFCPTSSLPASVCFLNDQGETPWDPPLLLPDVFTPDKELTAGNVGRAVEGLSRLGDARRDFPGRTGNNRCLHTCLPIAPLSGKSQPCRKSGLPSHAFYRGDVVVVLSSPRR